MNTTDHNLVKTEGSIMPQLVRDYLESLRTQNFSPKSIGTYENALDRFLSFLATLNRERLQDVTSSDLESYRLALVEGPLSSASTHLYLRVVRQWFNWLESRHLLFLNPFASVAIPRLDRRLLPVPSEDQINRLLSQPNTRTRCGLRDRALLETAYSTAARRGELCGMQLSDVDLDEGLVRVMGKGSKERMLPLGKEAVSWIRQYIEQARPKLLKGRSDQQALWVTTHGTRLGYISLAQLLRRYVVDAGIDMPISPHAIRRACATHMLRRGAHPAQLQLLLGHSSLKTLSHYLRLTIREIKAAHANSAPGQ